MTIDTSKWDKITFGEITKSLANTSKDPLSESLERYVGLEHLEPDNVHIKSWGNIAAGTTFTRVFRKGQVLFGKRRAYQRKTALAEFEGVCSGDILVFEAIEDKVLPELLPFIVQSDRFFNYAIKTSAGSLSPRTKFKDLANYILKLPPMDEQKRIADLLWSVDEVIQTYLCLWEKIDLLRKSYTENLIEDKTYPMKGIGELATVTSGNSAPQGDKYFNGDKPFIRVQHFSELDLFVNTFDLINDLAIKDYKLKLFPENSIVFTKSGASAYLEKKAKLKKPSYVVSHLGVLIADEEEVIADYLFYVFKGLNISKNCVSDYPTIDLSDIKRWEIPIPDKKNQQKIVCKFDEIIKSQEAIKKAEIELTEIKKQIINQIFG